MINLRMKTKIKGLGKGVGIQNPYTLYPYTPSPILHRQTLCVSSVHEYYTVACGFSLFFFTGTLEYPERKDRTLCCSG